MRELVVLFLHLLATVARLAGPGGAPDTAKGPPTDLPRQFPALPVCAGLFFTFRADTSVRASSACPLLAAGRQEGGSLLDDLKQGASSIAAR
jgi:hypothetical protein